jgi:nitrous oxidase accessory protein NosD
VPDEAATIQAAISVLGGTGTVWLQPGVYEESVTIPAFGCIAILGWAGSAHTNLFGRRGAPVIRVSPGGRLELGGLTIVGPGEGIGVHAAEGAHTVVRDCTVGGCEHGLWLDGRRAEVRSTQIERNRCWGIVSGAAETRLADLYVEGNGAGVWVRGVTSAVVERCYFWETGVGVLVQESTGVTLRDSAAVRNDIAGIAFRDCADCRLDGDVVVLGNTPGLWIEGTQGLSLRGVSAQSNHGFGAVLLRSSDINIEDSSFQLTAPYPAGPPFGDGLALLGSLADPPAAGDRRVFHIRGCVFHGNARAGLFASGNVDPSVLDDSVISNNEIGVALEAGAAPEIRPSVRFSGNVTDVSTGLAMGAAPVTAPPTLP